MEKEILELLQKGYIRQLVSTNNNIRIVKTKEDGKYHLLLKAPAIRKLLIVWGIKESTNNVIFHNEATDIAIREYLNGNITLAEYTDYWFWVCERFETCTPKEEKFIRKQKQKQILKEYGSLDKYVYKRLETDYNIKIGREHEWKKK